MKGLLFFGGLMTLSLVCRYTVRDIGFVSLVDAEWVVEATGPVDSQLELRALEALLKDANVTARVQPSNDLATRWALVSKDGLRLDLGQSTGESQDHGPARVRSLSEVLDSPLRANLSANMLDVFATVVLVAGADPEGVRHAEEQIESAIELLREIEPNLPRPLAGEVAVQVLPASERETERVALWSAGLLDLDPEQTALIMFYGRMKRVGEPLVGERLVTAEILSALALIGESCECDTDRDWAAEPRLPHRFGAEQHDFAATVLGFDPASPYVLAEVTRILSRGSAERTGTRAVADLGEVLFGYREGGLAGTDRPPVPEEAHAEAKGIDSTAGGTGDWGFPSQSDPVQDVGQDQGQGEDDSDQVSMAMAPWALVIFLVVCVGVAALIVFLGRRS